jgi:serine/threonine protein kinase
LTALEGLHELGYSHGDIKLDNICIRENEMRKIHSTLIDFGIATDLRNRDLRHRSTKYSFQGNFVFAT